VEVTLITVTKKFTEEDFNTFLLSRRSLHII